MRPRTEPTIFIGSEASRVELGRHADRDEEEAEQQPLERLDVDLQLVTVLGLGEDDASGEGAERHRQAGEPGDRRRAGDDEQRHRGEDLACLGATDEAKQRSHQVASAE